VCTGLNYLIVLTTGYGYVNWNELAPCTEYIDYISVVEQVIF
jgi:hypothetical protein